jgi:hypothetical protein
MSTPAFNTPIDDVRVLTIVITPAQFKNMDNTTVNAVQLLPPAGPNSAYELISHSINLQFPVAGGVAYGGGGGAAIEFAYDSGGSLVNLAASPITTAVLTAAQSGFSFGNLSSGLGNSSFVSAQVNKALLLGISGATKYTNGNSPLVLTLRYRINANLE